MSFIFEAQSAYTVDQELRIVSPRDPRGITLNTLNDDAMLSDMEKEIFVNGLCRDDLAVFATCVDTQVAAEVSYLMTSYKSHGCGVLVPGDHVLQSPDTHLTPELARKVSILPLEELVQFGIDSLAVFAKKRYPGLR